FMENVRIVIQNDKNSFETKTDKNGLFRFDGIPEGSYEIKPVPGVDYRTYFPAEEKIRILPDKRLVSEGYIPGNAYASFYTEFELGWNNNVEGVVTDIEGKPLERYVIGLLPLSKGSSEMFPYKSGSPDHHGEKGKFWSYGLTPGKYILAVDFYAPF